MIIVDPVYIVRQPEHITLSIVQVYDNYPKDEVQQGVFDMLAEMTDIVFVFSGHRTIDYRKFTTLHKGCGYTVCKKNSREENLLGVISYFKELYNKHLSYVLLNDWKIEEAEPFQVLKKLQDWNASTIVAPRMTFQRVSEEILAETYIPKYEKTWWGGKRVAYQRGCDFRTHECTSDFIYIKDIIFRRIFKKEKLEEYAETFTEGDPNTMMASLVTDLKIKTLGTYEV